MDLDEDSVHSDDEEISAETVLKTLQTAWQNERLAPELLPHRSEVVECMLGQIQHMERNLNKLKSTDFRANIHKMELSRIKFIISNYLKTRLNKIEKYCFAIVHEESHRIQTGNGYLSPSEHQYALEYLANMEKHLRTVVLDKVPSNMQNFEMQKMKILPNLQSHVFLKANVAVNGVVLEDLSADQYEEIDLEEGSQHILQYQPIANLVKEDKVQLI